MDRRISDLRHTRLPVITKCATPDHKCSRIIDVFCSVYAYPKAKWRLGDCPMADNELKTTTAPGKSKTKVRVGQQKQRKRR